MSISLPPAPDETSKEPALKAGLVVGFVGAVIATGVAFGLKLTPEQSTALIGLATFAAPVVSAIWTRRKVFSPATVAELLRKYGR